MKKALIGLFLGSLLLLGPHVAGAATYFYADPDASGTQNGSASNPWHSLSDSGAWTAINNALAGDDVVVYFSARQAGSDTDETTTGGLTVARTNTSSHRLTLTGMDKWNTNDSSPSWADYNGSSRFKVTNGPSQAFLYMPDDDYVTLRGFKVVGNGSPEHVVQVAGSHVIIERCDVSGMSNASMFQFRYAIDSSGSCDDIIIRDNVFHDGYKELLYFGGCQDEDRYGHTNVQILDNHIYNSTGDGLDIKDGNRYITVRGNIIHNNNGDGIVSHSAYLAEKNRVYNNGGRGIHHSNMWGRREDTHNGDVWRNNLLYGNGNDNMQLNDSGSNPSIRNARIYNNTCYNAGAHNIWIDSNVYDVYVQNNIAYQSGSTNISISASGTVVNDHNYTQNPSFLNAAAGDFSLQPGSPCIDAGVALTGFADDFRGASRPSGSAWDIGAYECGSASTPVPAPTGLIVTPE
jgi:hypothetical protein